MKLQIGVPIISAFCVFFIVIAPLQGSPSHHKIYDLSPNGTYWPGSHKINNIDQIVGSSYTADNEREGFLWDRLLGMSSLGTLGGTVTSSSDINNLGQVVGFSQTTDGNERAFSWENGSMSDLGSLAGDAAQSWANAINNSGQIVGYSETTDSGRHGFLWDNGTMTDIGTLGGYGSFARGINDAGQIVGESFTDQGNWHAFHWQDGQMADLGTLGGNRSEAYDINNDGQIVGYSRLNDGSDYNNSHAVLWESNGQLIDIGTLGSVEESKAMALNDSGQVVGYSYTDMWQQRAFLWDSTDGMIDLNSLLPIDSGWAYLETAFDISNSGHIVGIGYLEPEEGEELVCTEPHLFLMTPEPASVLLLALGATALCRKRRCQVNYRPC